MPGPDAIVRRVRVSGIQVSKFLGFRDVDMDFDRDLHIVAGANNAGKSSLVRMLEVFFEDPSGEDLMALHPLNSYYSEAGPRSLSSVAVWFTDLTDDERKTFVSTALENWTVAALEK
jgi:predicted ATP-dependent endonuclease of OLD family